MVAALLIPRPVGHPIARLERLADHRDLGAGHEVEARPLVREWQAQVGCAMDGHGRPPIRPHAERSVCSRGPPRVLPLAVDDVHPLSPDSGKRVVPDRRRLAQQQRHQRVPVLPMAASPLGGSARPVGPAKAS